MLGFCRSEIKPSGPVHLNTELGAEELPEMTAVVVAQVSTAPVAVAPGGAVLAVTDAVAVAVQPLLPLPLVMVTV